MFYKMQQIKIFYREEWFRVVMLELYYSSLKSLLAQCLKIWTRNQKVVVSTTSSEHSDFCRLSRSLLSLGGGAP